MQKRLLFLMTLLLTVITAVAQVTTSSMAGKVTYVGSQETIIGATVLAVHEPSGTRYTAITNYNGTLETVNKENYIYSLNGKTE